MGGRPVPAKFDRLALGMTDAVEASRCAIATLDAIQRWRPEQMLAALCVAFLALCEKLEVDPQDAFTITKNMLDRSGEGDKPAALSVGDFIEGEVLK